VRAAIRIIFQALYFGWNGILVATKINNTIFTLMTATTMTDSDATYVISTVGAIFGFQQRLVAIAFVQVVINDPYGSAAPW
jgi:glucose-6-phosphate-specific signal transduction histidine kinase